MKNSYQNSRDKLLQQSLDFLWRQWTSLGVPGNRSYAGDAIIDPEALLLITTELGRDDARLLDLAIDWLHQEGKRINLQRLKGLKGAVHAGNTRVLAGIAEILSEQSVLRKWETLRSSSHVGDPDEERMIPASGGVSAVHVVRNPDPRFMRHGLHYPQWKPRHACLPPSPGRPENLLLTLRSLFGVNARAEIMAWLLTHDSGHPAVIARDTGYFSKSIQAALNEMEASGVIVAERAGREKHFRLRKHDWADLFGFAASTPPPRWIAWPWVYDLIHHTLRLLEKSCTEDVSPLLHSVLQRDFLNEVAPHLRESGLRPQMVAEVALKGKHLADAVLRDVARLGELLEDDFNQSGSGGPQVPLAAAWHHLQSQARPPSP